MFLLLLPFAHAQIETDGSLGPAQALNGKDFVINENLGNRAGNNLFHSFREFNLHQGESATFTGASEIANVISRVTGGKLSTIDGLLKSEIPNANLYLINPAGILFGPNASLSINGSFHVSNADFIRLGDADLFYSEPLKGEILSTAAPKAFGFFGAPTGNIVVKGSQFNLDEKATLSLVGGKITIEDEAEMRVPQGQINLIGVNSAGEATWDSPTGRRELGASAFTTLNEIHISSGSELNVDGNGGGRVVIRGGQLTLKDAVISARTTQDQSGRGVDIKSDRFDFVRSQLNTTTIGTGNAGEIQIDAKILVLNGLGGSGPVGIFANSKDLISSNIGQNTIGSGKAGAITIAANQVDIRGDTAIETTAIVPENTGVIDLSTTELTLDGFGAKFQVNSGKGEFTRFTGGNIILDGSLNPDRNGEVLAGADYEITADMGRAVENNLFHSFRSFFIDEGETATFSGPATISNIVTRVTGDNATNIYGGLNVEIPEANLYFINPNGLFFGPNARLSLPGSFHIGTADYLTFQGGGRFDAGVPDESILDGSELSAYGFRDDKIGEITIEGRLNVSEEKIFSLIGGNLRLQDNDSRVIANSGQVNLVSLQSAGEVSIVNGSNDPDVSEFRKFGNIAIIDNAAANVTNSPNSDSSAGRLFVRSNDLRLDNGGELRARNVGEGAGGSTDLLIYGDLFIGKASGIEMDGDGILGQLSIEAENITINGAGQEQLAGIEIFQFGEIEGSENNLRIKAKQNLNILNGGVINTSTTGAGNAGSTIIQANALTIDGQGATFAGIGSVSDYSATGDGGDLDIQIAKQMEIINGGTINISTFSEVGGSGGKARIRAKDLIINGGGLNDSQTGIIALSSDNTKGNSGNLDINIEEHLQVLDGGVVNTSTFGTGNAGSITIQTKNLTLDGQDSDFAGIGSIAGPEATGNGGDLHILVTEQMEIIDSGIIDASTFGIGDAGSITVQAKNLTIDGQDSGFTGIVSAANSDFNSNGGNIEITINERFEIVNGGEISAFAKTGNAGNLNISAGGDIRIENSLLSISAGQENFNVNDYLDDFQRLFIEAGDSIYIKDSLLSTDAGVLGSKRGAGGDIYLHAPIEIWLENSILLAQAGYIGGNVYIDPMRYIVLSSDVIAQADFQGGNYSVIVSIPNGWIQSADSLINLSGEQSGAVLSTTTPFDLGAELSDLNLDFLNVENWASQPCKLRLGGAGSSFEVVNWRGVSNNMDDFLPSEPILLTTDHNVSTTDPATDEFLQKAIFPELNDECEDCP